MQGKTSGAGLLVLALLICGAARGEPATAAAPRCDADNGGLVLPEGFCALVVADDLGQARHLTVARDGDIFVAIRGNRGGIVALRDRDGDGRADVREPFGRRGGTGIRMHQGYLYFAPDTVIVRYRRRAGMLVPDSDPEVVVSDLPAQTQHAVKPFEFDNEGWIYVNVGAPSNACQQQARSPGSPGIDPCPQLEQHGGVWRFRVSEQGQSGLAAGERYATGIRNGVANAWNEQTGKLYVIQHGRDQLSELWPEHYDDSQRAELPAEEMFEVDQGDDFGWPYCYYDPHKRKKVLAPEYGGDGEKVGRCSEAGDPIAVFPAHWAPNDLLFYTGEQFPQRFRGGAFVAFHGSWNRQPFPQAGYSVVFLPFADGAPAGDYEVFADGFAGAEVIHGPGEAKHRPVGLAQGPDGSLYISDSVKGRIWRVVYRGGL